VDLLLAQTSVGQASNLSGSDSQPDLRISSGILRTTLDSELQSFVERTLRDHLSRLSGQHVRDGAAVVLDNRTGDVLALVGSPDYSRPDSGQVNGAWAARSAGSTLKPFTYLLALERGASAATVVEDLPAEFATATGVFAPVNYNRRCFGPMRYRLALANSLNISAVKVLDSIGGSAVLCERLQAWGLTTLNEAPEHYGLGLTIGNAEVRLLELANAYATLARLGEFRPYRLTADESSRNSHPASHISPHAWLIADILADNSARAMAFGLESPLRFDFPVACKTGTSSDYRDNWAMGFTPEFTVGVWAGNFDGSPMQAVSGVSGAAPVLHDIFVNLHERFGTTWFTRPTNIVERMVHPVTGRWVDAGRRGAVREFFSADALPESERPDDYDARGRVRLPSTYREWLASGDNWIGRGAVADNTRPTTNKLRVLSPVAGTVFFLDLDLGEPGRLIPLRAEGSGALEWQCETLSCRNGPNGACAVMLEGRHRLTVRHRESGATAETWVEIKRL
jgi:penicillin-binding protein 1C